MPTSSQTDLAQPFGVPLAKGVALGERLADGRILVRGLPFFSEVRETDPGAEMGAREVRDRAWLEGALAKHRARRVLGQAPPLCLRHCFDDPERVGEYELTHIEEVQVNPDELPRATLMGNKVYLDHFAFERSKDYDFRSAEISPEKPGELSAVALLKDKAPFFSYPNTVERLAPQTVAAFELFRAKGGSAPQVWAGRPETFGTATEVRSPTRTSTVADTRGNVTVTGGAGDGATNVTINPPPESSQTTKEGSMPAPEVKDEKKAAPSIEERMEAMATKFFESLSKRFESLIAGKGDEKKPADEDGKTPVQDAAKLEKKQEEDKKTEAAQATGGPNDLLPPAVSQLRPGETFGARNVAPPIPEQFATRIATQDTAILGLRAQLDKLQREKDAVALVAEARKTLADMGVSSVPEAFEAALAGAAVKSGKQGIDDLLATVKLTMGLASRGPELYGAMAGGSAAALTPFEADVKKAVETFGARPEVRSRIQELASRYRGEGEHFVRNLAAGEFFQTCQGIPSINPQVSEAYGGLPPVYDPRTGQKLRSV